MSWRKDKTTNERGYDYKWQKARISFLSLHPLCVMCEREGRITAATVVDHRVPHQGNEALFWDQTNWDPLCKKHHDSDKKMIEAGKKPRPTIGLDGFPVA